MTAIDLLLAGLVLAAMTALAAVDARRLLVEPLLVLALVGSGLLWRLFGSAATGSFWGAGLGAALGVLVVAVPIAVAHCCGRRWPLFPGDAMLLGGIGFVLGPLGLGWSVLAGSVCALLHRVWLQRRRGRPIARGYCPLGPGMVAGAMAVFVFVNAGGSLAADGATAELGPPLHPGPIRASGAEAMLAATEHAPVRVPLPEGLGAREVAVDEAAPLSFAAVTGRIAALAGVRVEVEERPARVAGGAVRLPDPPDVRFAFEGPLPRLLDLVAARTGYEWTWDAGAIVFYRYRDIEQRLPDANAAADSRAGATLADGADGATGRWIVDRARHGTLRAVLEDWGAQAGWSVVWKPRRRYAVGADASFEGGFLDAVDLLLAAPATRRALVALAYEPNRHLVIEAAGALQ